MRLNFRNGSLLVLALTALPCSRMVFALINDPEGPNLLVVVVLAAVIWLISLAAYLSRVLPSLTGAARSLAAIVVQLFLATGFYLALR